MTPRVVLTIAVLAGAAACGSPSELPVQTRVLDGQTVTNGSFEQNYTGWTIEHNPNDSECTWGIASNGQTIAFEQQVLDFVTNTEIQQFSPGLPFTYQATDGNLLAIQLVNGPDDNRMYQDITVPSCEAVVKWDMAYNNHTPSFNPSPTEGQFLALNIRDPLSDGILSTPYQTVQGANPLSVAPMTTFTADISGFETQTVRLDFEVEQTQGYFDAEFDNIRVQCKGLSPDPSTVAFGNVAVGSFANLSTTITNESSSTIDLGQLTIAPAGSTFTVTGEPSLPDSIPPGGTAQIQLTFVPPAAGSASGTLTLVSDDPNGNLTIPLTGAGLGPSLSVSPTSLTFPTTQVNDTSPTQPVTIQNIGGAALTVSSVAVSQPFIATGSASFTLQAGSSATVEVAFSPNVAGTANANLVVQSTDGEQASVACTGSAQAPTIALSTSALTYAAQGVGTQSAPQPVIVNNTGVGAITLQSIAATAPFVVVDEPALPATIAAGSSAEIDVAFAPTASGPAAGAVTVVTVEAGSASAILGGTGIAPVISAAISSFGNQHVNTTGTQQLVITNNGTAPLDISGLSTTAPFSVATTTATIGAGSAQSFPVSFTPTQVGPGSGVVTVTSDDPVTPALPVSVTGTGTIGIVQFSPGTLGFGNQRTGTVSSLPLTITNVGTGNLNISSAGVAGGPFAGALGATVVAPGSAAQVTVTFEPSVDGPASTTLSVISDSPTSPDTIAVIGTGVEPIATPNVTAVSFGTQRVGTTSSPAQTVTVQNTGTSALTISSFGTTGPFNATGPSTPVVLAIGQSTQFSATFSPTTTGTANGSLSIATNATNPSIALSGTGTAPAIAATPTSLSFGNQRLNTTSPSQTLTVTNPGTASLSITSATPPAGFVVTPPSALPIHVLPNASASFGVTFAPTALGTAAGAVVFASDASTSPTSVTVSGTGVQAVAAVSPASQDFGSVRVGSTSSPIPLSITNSGNDAFGVTAITVPPPFVVVSAPSLPTSVPGGGSIGISVAFAASTQGPASVQLVVATDSAFVSATLTGQGVASAIAANLNPIEYGSVSVHTTSTLALQLSNPGTAPLTISGLQLGGANASDFALVPQPSLPATVAVGDALTVGVAFTPSQLGDRSAQLVATSDALGSASLSIGLDGRGIGAHAVLSPATLDFGSTIVGSASPPLAVTVANTGDDQLVVSSVVLGGANGVDFTESQALPLVIPAGSAAPVAFQFAPTAGGERTATATFQTSDPFAPTATLSLVGGGQTPTIAAAPDVLAFGPVRVGSDASLPVVLSNQGSGALTITAVSLAGSNADFTLTPVTLPIAIAPGGSTTLHVGYAPTAIAGETSTLTVTSDDPVNGTLAVPISGTGVSPSVAVTPSALDFGGELVGRTSAPRQVTIQNTGTGAMSITSLAISGAQSAVFELVNPPNLPTAISTGGQLVLSATVAPAMVGADAADLTITTDVNGATAATVQLAVVGISTALAVSPTSLDFGTTHAGSAAKPLTVTLSNLSSDAITLTGGVVIGMTPADFSVGTVAGTLAAGSSATATVSYDPAAAASSAATIDFGTSDATIPDAQVAITGRSVSTYLAANASKLAFGSIEVGGDSGTRLVTIENITTAPLAIADIAAGDAQFVVDASGVPAMLPAGATAQFGVTFAPTRDGSAASTVAITLTGASTPELAIALTGDGASRPSVGGCTTGGDARWFVGVVVLGLALRRRRRR